MGMRHEGFTQSMTLNWRLCFCYKTLCVFAIKHITGDTVTTGMVPEDQTIIYHVNFLISKIILRACPYLKETQYNVFGDDVASRWQFALMWFIKKKTKFLSLYYTSPIL